MRKDWNALTPLLKQAMDAAVAAGEEHSCQLAIYHDGRRVVSLCSGQATEETLFPVFSCSKSVTATVVARLVGKGLLSYDMPVRDLWPEFACNGKEEMQLWHFMSHRASLVRMPAPFPSPEVVDWNHMCKLMAAATPSGPIGGVQEYHGITYAWLVGEMIQRATGKPFAQVLKEEVTGPLGIADDIIYGSNDEIDRRYLPVDGSAFGDRKDWCSLIMNDAAIRHACIPSANGLMTANALARHYAALIGEVDGVRLVKPELLKQATTLCRSDDDPITDWGRFGMGYALMGPENDRGDVFGQGGACGSEGFAVQHEGVAVAFTKNKSLPQHPHHKIRDTLSDILGLEHRLW